MDRAAFGQTIGDRDLQEDAGLILFQSDTDPTSDILLILADGMGGHAGGDVASHTAVEQFAHHFQSVSTNLRPRGRLREALDAANAALADRVEQDPDLKGMGCTLIGALLASNRLIWVSAGDSILFRYSYGQLTRLNADHSYFSELLDLVDRGEMTREEAERHPQKNALRSALTGRDLTLVDLDAIELAPGDVVILASDGVETLKDADIAQVVQANLRDGPQAIVDALLGAVADRAVAKQDNTSVIAVCHERAGVITQSEDTKWQLAPSSAENRMMQGLLVGAGILVIAVVTFLLWPKGAAPLPEPATTLSQPSQAAPSVAETGSGSNAIETEPSPLGDEDDAEDQSQIPEPDQEDTPVTPLPSIPVETPVDPLDRPSSDTPEPDPNEGG